MGTTLGVATLATLLAADPAATQQATEAPTNGVFIGAVGLLSNDVAGDVALFGEGAARLAGTHIRFRASYATGVISAGDDRHAAVLRDPTVHGRSLEVSAAYRLRLSSGLLIVPRAHGGVNFADWAAAAPDLRRESGAVLFAAAGLAASSADLAQGPAREMRAVAEIAILGRWIRSGIGKNHDLRLALLGSDRREYTGVEGSLSIETPLLKPGLRLTWFPRGGDIGIPGLTDTRLSAEVQVRAPLF